MERSLGAEPTGNQYGANLRISVLALLIREARSASGSDDDVSNTVLDRAGGCVGVEKSDICKGLAVETGRQRTVVGYTLLAVSDE